jgi:hypothetical protein
MPSFQLTYDSIDPVLCSDPNVLLHVAWGNMVKCVKLVYNESKKRFDIQKIFSRDFQSVSICGLLTVKQTYSSSFDQKHKTLQSSYHLVQTPPLQHLKLSFTVDVLDDSSPVQQ